MKAIRHLSTLVLLTSLCFAQAGKPSAKPAAAPKAAPKQYTIEQFLKTERVGHLSISSNDKWLLYDSNKTGVYNVYTTPIDQKSPRPITNSAKETTTAVSYFPHDNRVLFTQDQGGNELNHLYVQEEHGAARDLTPGTKLKAQFEGWSKDGNAFYVSTNERDPKSFDVYRYNSKDFARTIVFQNPGGFDDFKVDPAGRYVAMHKTDTTTNNDIYLYDVQSKQTKNLTAHTGEVLSSAEDFSPDGKVLLYLTNVDSEFMYPATYDLATGKSSPLEKANWDYMYARYSKNGRYRLTAINEDARTKINIVDTKTNKPVALPKLPAGDITGVTISDSEKKMAFLLSGDTSPANIYTYDFATGKATRVTDTINPEIAQSDLVDGTVVRYKSFDGLEIPSILWTPHQASANAKVPALVWVHGGPGGQTRKGYSGVIQYLVNHGYAVLAVNNRGSSGYGKTFFVADDQKHGREPLWDCIEAKKYLQANAAIDKNKIGIIGGSYGGYMVLAALAFKPEEFAVGVDLFGVANWVRTLKSIPPWWESFRKALYKELGDPNTQEQMLHEISPVFYPEKITKPLIVLQGENDPRVLKAESDDMVNAIKKKGGVVEYVVLPGEGHGFSKRENEIKAYGAILPFLEKYLKGEGAAAAPSN
jgi:dipeptidyl aminopeptidase/acylaminoacyl peptidase